MSMQRRLLPLIVSAVVASALIAAPAVAQRAAATHQKRKMVPAVRATARMVHVRAAVAGTDANWTNLANMTVAVTENGGAAFAQKKVYVPGGFRDFTTPPTLYSHMQIYNASTNKWVVV